jgi:hypothetical protein
MRALLVAAFMAATTATMTVLGLPIQFPTEVNYCPDGFLAANTHLHTGVSHTTYTSGVGCVLRQNRLLNLTAEPLQYWEPNNTAPVTAVFSGGQVEAGAAIYLRAPDFGFVDLMVPWVVRVTDNSFGQNAVVHFHGCLPKDSQVTISGNVFAGNDATNSAIYQDGYIASISFGVLDPGFNNPLHFGIRSEVVVADNIVNGVTGGLGKEASGIRIIPASFFLADHSRMLVRNNSVTATGISTNPGIPFNMKGYINVIPEYNGTTNVTFEFRDNVANALRGIAWWLPGLWGPRGARDLKMIVTGNTGTVNDVVNNDKWAAIHSVVNCTGEGHFTFESNTVTVTTTEANLVFYEQLSEGGSVRIANNVFDVKNGNARFNVLRWEGVQHAEIFNNKVTSSNEVIVQIFAINGTDMTGGISSNNFGGSTVAVIIPVLRIAGGEFVCEDNIIAGRNGPAAIEVKDTTLTDGAVVSFRRWAAEGFTTLTLSLSGSLNLVDSQFHLQDGSFTTKDGNLILNFPNTYITGRSLLNVSSNKLTSAGGSPSLRFSGNVTADDDSAIHLTFNSLYRSDNADGATLNFIDLIQDISLGNDAQLGVWNNTFNVRNTNRPLVGMLIVRGQVSTQNDTAVNICDNVYYVSTNQTVMMMVVTPALARVVNCVNYLPTIPLTTTTETSLPTTQAESEPATTDVDGSTVPVPGATTTEPFTDNNSAPVAASGASLLVFTLVAAAVASLLAL